MKYLCALALTAACAAGFSTAAHATWGLVWADEFNGTSLNTADWNYDIGNGCPSLCGWGNNELQYYRSENVSVTGGNLVLTAKNESFGGYSFTSGKIHTRFKQGFLYGRIEMRAKIPTGGGMWPAFWMMPQDDVYGGWAASGEIDIMEAANSTDVIGGTIHFGGAWPNNTSTGASYVDNGVNFADDFHIYAVEWEADTMRWYVDDVLYSVKTSAQWYTDAAPLNPQAPFDQAFYLILNTAVGGNYTGCTNPGCITASFDQEFLVDYVRVYADIPNALPTVSITSPNSGVTIPAGNVVIDANASDTDGTIATVEFYNGFDYLGEDTSAPYSFTWTSVADGCYDIMVRVIDDQGGTATDTIDDVTVGSGCGQLPYFGLPTTLPAVIEAENYDHGGANVAYDDTDAGNNGLVYRFDDVDIETCTDVGGGFNVGWAAPGEWMEYTVAAPVAGVYPIEVRVASQSQGGTFHLEVGGADVSGTVNVPITGGWQTWTTVAFNVTLIQGTQTIRYIVDSGEYNINHFNFLSAPTAVPDLASRLNLRSFPNPFNPRTTIQFELAAPTHVDLTVYDATGRRVRTLLDGSTMGPGSHDVVWNGQDGSGAPVAAGVYFLRLNAGPASERLRMVLLK